MIYGSYSKIQLKCDDTSSYPSVCIPGDLNNMEVKWGTGVGILENTL